MAMLLSATGGAEPGQLSAANLVANAVAIFPTVVITDPLLGLAKRSELLPIVWALRVEFVRPCNLCPHMKRITLPKILRSLENLEHRVEIAPEIGVRARRAVERMLEVARGAKR